MKRKIREDTNSKNVMSLKDFKWIKVQLTARPPAFFLLKREIWISEEEEEEEEEPDLYQKSL